MASRATVRLGFVGTAHLHFGGLLKAALASPLVQMVGTVFEDDALRDHFQREHSGLPVFDAAEALYERAKPDAVITCADNTSAAGVVAGAAARGIHVMKETPMASSLTLADEMLAGANRYGVRLMINWPTNWLPAIHHAKQLVDAGAIGRVWQVHHRAGHGGPPPDYLNGDPVSRVGWDWLIDRGRNGGGAAVDFCSYGAVLSRWLMGQPTRVMGMGGRYTKDFFTVDDNAVLVLGYHRGHAICEGTWTQPAVPVRIPSMIYGEAGAIALVGPANPRLANRGAAGEQVSEEADEITAPALPDSYQSAPHYFAHCLLTDTPFSGIVSSTVSRDAQEILEAGLMSMRSGSAVGLPLPASVVEHSAGSGVDR